MSRRSVADVRARRAPGRFRRLVRVLLGIALLLLVLYAAVALLIDPRWAMPVTGAVVVLLLVALLVGLSRRRRRRRTLRHLLAGTPTEFEETVAGLMRREGFRHVHRVGGAGDLTVDVMAHDRAGRLVIVQCKRYLPTRPVGSKEMQTFIGMLTIHHHADYGLYVTTAGFTGPAIALARQHGITLVDGAMLTAMLAGGQRGGWIRR